MGEVARKPKTPKKVRVFVADHTQNRQREARLSNASPMRELVPALVLALDLPQVDQSGRAVRYYLAFGRTALKPTDTLHSANVQDGSTVTLVPEMTAGAIPGVGSASNRREDPVRRGRPPVRDAARERAIVGVRL